VSDISDAGHVPGKNDKLDIHPGAPGIFREATELESMNTKIVLAGIIAALMLSPLAGAFDLKAEPIDLLALAPANLGCGEGLDHEATFPDPNAPAGTLVTIHLDCATDLVLDNHMGTDCPGHSWSHWQGPAAQAWTYTFDTANPFGFSQSAVASAWNAANLEWEKYAGLNIYNGYTVATVSATSGTYDSYTLAEFRSMGGQLRNAVGVQWAWASGGKIVHTDAAYNTNYPFSLTGAPNTYDLQSIAAHEMGHGFGMGHSDTSTASRCLTVYPYATLGATHGRTLGDGDILGIQARY